MSLKTKTANNSQKLAKTISNIVDRSKTLESAVIESTLHLNKYTKNLVDRTPIVSKSVTARLAAAAALSKAITQIVYDAEAVSAKQGESAGLAALKAGVRALCES